MSKKVTHVKLCVNPDWCCLEGGCGYCDSGTFKSVEYLEKYAKKIGVKTYEGTTVTRDYVKSFTYGRNSGWPNRDKRYQS